MVLRLIKDQIKRMQMGSERSSGSGSTGRENSINGHDPSLTNPKYRPHDEIVAERLRRTEEKARRSGSLNRLSISKRRDQVFLEEGPQEMTSLYKPLSMNMSKRREYPERLRLQDVDVEKLEGQIVTFAARVHTVRRMSAKLVFVVLRQQILTIQGVLQSNVSGITPVPVGVPLITEDMVRAVEHYQAESIVLVKGLIRAPIQKVKNATIHDAEVDILEIHPVTTLTENVPFTVYDAENITKSQSRAEDIDEESTAERIPRSLISPSSPTSPVGHLNSSAEASPERASIGSVDALLVSKASVKGKHANTMRTLPQRVRLNNRIVDLRTSSSQSIFRIQSGIGNIFRSYLDEKGFIEIHTPKLQPAATESGSSVFEVKYFGRQAFLAQSPQLAKQMAIASDFRRVYEVGPVFRAEDSNTPRHLTEYTGLDLEMALDEHYHEALDIIDGMFKHLWKTIYERYAKEIDIISEYYPQEKVIWLENTPRIPFWQGVEMLKKDGWVDEDGNPPKDTEDLATAAEKRLGAIVREIYKTDYYILDKFPASVRPFYTMPDPTNDKFSNSFDIFMRGQEILSGGQRIHDAKFLEERMIRAGVKPEYMDEYMEGFRWGAPPHAGAGIGLERLTFLFLNLGNIRLASMFPRDPKSLPARPVVLELRHPEASTTQPPWLKPDIALENRCFQPIEKLIANYGDAANTSWLDERYEKWRHPNTGAIQGFIVHDSHVIAVGEPLCDKSQHPQVVSAFLDYLKTDRKGLKPIWMIIGTELEEILGNKFNWRSISAMAEERADPRNNPAFKNPDLSRKIRHAEQEGIKYIEWPAHETLPQDLKDRIDARCHDWKKNRKGQQVHLTEIRPWVDEEHRRYFYAAEGSKEGTIHAIVVMHRLSPQNGYQMKFSLEFPGAPSGTIEGLSLHAMAAVAAQEPALKQVTFGTGAMGELAGGRNLGKGKMRLLRKSYETINKSLHLTSKSEFREKLGAKNDRVYIAWPKGGLGAGGIKAILGFLEG